MSIQLQSRIGDFEALDTQGFDPRPHEYGLLDGTWLEGTNRIHCSAKLTDVNNLQIILNQQSPILQANDPYW